MYSGVGKKFIFWRFFLIKVFLNVLDMCICIYLMGGLKGEDRFRYFWFKNNMGIIVIFFILDKYFRCYFLF